MKDFKTYESRALARWAVVSSRIRNGTWESACVEYRRAVEEGR